MALNYPVGAILKEDNAAALISANKGYSPVVRGLKRTQRVSIGYIHDVISAPLSPAVAPSQWRSKRLRPTVVTCSPSPSTPASTLPRSR